MSEIDNLLSFIPEQYRGKVVLAAALSPYVTRAYHSLRSGGGLSGVLRSIWFGTNTSPDLQKRLEAVEASTVKMAKPD